MDFVQTQPNNSNPKYFSATYGGSAIASTTQTTSAGAETFIRMRENGTTSGQITTVNNNGGIGNSLTITRTSVSETSAQNVVLQLELQSASDYLIIEGYSIKVFPN